jgi:catechol 2,3-dioxygenase-like lactoylglutathione lyase family enzyme
MPTGPDQSGELKLVVTNTLIVGDIQRSVAFYRDVLGATVLRDGEPAFLRLGNIWYSHEVIGAGFWPGNGGYGQAAFYADAAPVPEGLDKTVLSAKGGFNAKMGEFILDYAEARASEDPVETVLEFLEETYSAAADAARWDRATLDRRDEVAEAIRLRRPQRHPGSVR